MSTAKQAEAAEQELRRAGLAAEVRALVEDKAYVREAQDLASLMEGLRGPCSSQSAYLPARAVVLHDAKPTRQLDSPGKRA